MLAGVFDGEYLDDRGHLIDDDIIGRNQGFASAWHAASTIYIRMVRQAICGMTDGIAGPIGCGRVLRFDEAKDAFEIIQRLGMPDERQHQAFLRRSMMACIRAIASSCGMPGLSDAILASIVARNQAS